MAWRNEQIISLDPRTVMQKIWDHGALHLHLCRDVPEFTDDNMIDQALFAYQKEVGEIWGIDK